MLRKKLNFPPAAVDNYHDAFTLLFDILVMVFKAVRCA